MLRFLHQGSRLCDGLSRREWLRVGGIGSLGFSLPQLFAQRAAAETKNATARSESTSPGVMGAPKAKACIQLFLWGGPGAQETWDPKPEAPVENRGEFQAIATSLPGVQFSEHLPQLARRAHQYTIIRSQTHDGVNHGTSSYHMLTGHVHRTPGTLRHPEKSDVPNLGASASRFLKHPTDLPACVHLPSIVNDGDGLPVPGQGAGLLGDRYEPFAVLGDLTQKNFRVPSLTLQDGVTRQRLDDRRDLQRIIAARAEHLDQTSAVQAADASWLRALDLLGSSRTAAAFDLAREPQALRERYGYHHFAQSLLMARRLVEAGVPYVTVYWNAPRNTDNQSWDTHNNQHVRMRDHLLPPFDKALSAFLDDMQDRGLLDETLVTWWGEFGRTPKINRNVGREHWGFCQSVGLAGGGVQRGLVYGTSTKDGGYPETLPVRPDDLSATMFHLLGIDHKQHMHDLQGRPFPLSYGEPVHDILA
ncbi:MAG: DUF1501 domain-containing protein [Planctomycetaceae bacterium]|nr:DUF1501 domain-containing protein [Planctomycetaceae bacterium]